MSVIKKPPPTTQRPDVVPVPQYRGVGVYDVTVCGGPRCPKCGGPARTMMIVGHFGESFRTQCDKCGESPIGPPPGSLSEFAGKIGVPKSAILPTPNPFLSPGLRLADVAAATEKLATIGVTLPRGPCRRCGCTRVGKFCAGCGIQDGDKVERRRRPRKRPCWLWHRWEYLDIPSMRACRRCGAVQQYRVIDRWLDVPGEMARKPVQKSIDTAGHVIAQSVKIGEDGIVRTHIELEGVRPVQQNPYVEPGVWIG